MSALDPNKIKGCFGNNDLIFALHSCDEERAFDLLVELRNEEITWEDTEKAFVDFLNSQKADINHINSQMKKVEDRYRVWLY